MSVERKVTIEGQTFHLERVDAFGEWRVYWDPEPPPGCHPQLGALGWAHVPGATPTTGLGIVNVDQIDRERKEELLARVAVAAGLTLRPLRYVGKPNYDA